MQLVSSLVRGEMLSRIDASLRNPTQGHLDALRKSPLWQVAEDTGNLHNDKEREHARFDGLGDRWWPEHAAKEEILRTAYIRAVEIALAAGRRKPILTLWVRGLDRFEAAVVETDTEILVHWLTPDPPAAPPPPADTVAPRLEEKVWAVGEAKRIDTYVQSFMTQGYQVTADRTVTYPALEAAKAFHVIGY